MPITSASGSFSTVEGTGGSNTQTYTFTSATAGTFSFYVFPFTATDPGDITANRNENVVLAANGSITLNVPIVTDSLFEGAETFTLQAFRAGGALVEQQVVTITDDDAAPTVSLGTGIVTGVEGNTVSGGNASFTVTLSAASGLDTTVPYTISGANITASDFTANSLSGQIVITAGQTSGVIVLPFAPDTVVESNEVFAVSLGAPTNATLSGGSQTQAGTIPNDDAAPAPVPPGVPAPSGNYTVNGQAYIDRDYVAPMGDRVDAIFVQDGSTTNAINITGNAVSQTITGNNGANIINGLGGADTMIGLGGNDQYLVRGPGDVVIEANGGGTDTVFTTVSYNLGANEVEVLSTVTNSDTIAIDLTGNFATQTIIGNYGNNVLNGGSGGLDTLIGLRGNDVYAVGDSRTVIVENAGEGADTVVTSVDYTLAAGVSVEVLAAQDRAGNISLALRGNEIAQTIVGNNGANVLDGGLGSDTLAGGGGADSFRFTTALGANNIDSVVDFESIDKIGLGAGIFGLTAVTAANFTVGAAATTADQRIVYNQATGQLFFDADGNGAAAAVLFAMFAPNTVLAAANFEIV